MNQNHLQRIWSKLSSWIRYYKALLQQQQLRATVHYSVGSVTKVDTSQTRVPIPTQECVTHVANPDTYPELVHQITTPISTATDRIIMETMAPTAMPGGGQTTVVMATMVTITETEIHTGQTTPNMVAMATTTITMDMEDMVTMATTTTTMDRGDMVTMGTTTATVGMGDMPTTTMAMDGGMATHQHHACDAEIGESTQFIGLPIVHTDVKYVDRQDTQ